MKNYVPGWSRLSKIFLLLCVFMYVTSCNQDGVDPELPTGPEKASARLKYSQGEELFRGIFLLEGEVAGKIDMYQQFLAEMAEQRKKNPEFDKVRAEYNSKVVKKVKELDKRFLDRLEAAVASKEYDAISRVFEHGSLLLKSIFYIETSENLNPHLSRKSKELNPGAYDFAKTGDVKRFLSHAKKLFPEDEMMRLLREDPAYANHSLLAFAAAAAFVAVVAVWDVAVVINVAAAVNVFAAVFALTEVIGDDVGREGEEGKPIGEGSDGKEPEISGDDTPPIVTSFTGARMASPEKGNLKKELLIRQIAFDL